LNVTQFCTRDKSQVTVKPIVYAKQKPSANEVMLVMFICIICFIITLFPLALKSPIGGVVS